MLVGSPPHVHQEVRDAKTGDGRSHVGAQGSTTDVVDDISATFFDGSAGDEAVEGIDGDQGAI